MNTLAKYMLGSAGLLILFALGGTVPVAWLQSATAERIAENLQQARLKSINEVIDANLYDNNILDAQQLVTDESLIPGGVPAVIYTATKNELLVATVIETIAPDGYSGNIRLLIGIDPAGKLTGVRILEHRETPGLGDTIDQYHSDYLDVFTGKSLGNPLESRWAVKKDGGDFDQLTGATITPRAVVQAVKRALLYYNANQPQPEESSANQHGK